MFVHMRIKRRGGGGKENRYSAPSSSRFDRNNDLTNRNEVCFHFDVLVFSIITFFILCLSFSFTNNNNDDDDETDRHTHTYGHIRRRLSIPSTCLLCSSPNHAQDNEIN